MCLFRIFSKKKKHNVIKTDYDFSKLYCCKDVRNIAISYNERLLALEGGSTTEYATKNYVDNKLATKVDKVTTASILYGTNYKGNPYYFKVTTTPVDTDGIPLYYNGRLKSNTPEDSLDVVNLSYFNTHTINADRIGVGVDYEIGSYLQKMDLSCPHKIAIVQFQLNSNLDHASKIVEVLDNGIRFNDNFYEFEEGTSRVLLTNWYQSNYSFTWKPSTATLQVLCNKATSEKRISGIGL